MDRFVVDVLLPPFFGIPQTLPQDWKGWAGFFLHWLSHSGWRELVSIYLAFLIVVGLSVRAASNIHWTGIGYLSERLAGADRFIGVGTIPIREWFDPNAIVYLATILSQQRKSQTFRQERVLLFCDEDELRAVHASFLDQHYAQSLAAVHERLGIDLAFLTPDDVRSMLLKLTPEEREALASYRWYSKLLPLWKRLLSPAAWKGKSRRWSFILLEKDGQRELLRFLKDGNSLDVLPITDECEIAACSSVVRLIEEAIYKQGTTQLSEYRKFSKYLCP